MKNKILNKNFFLATILALVFLAAPLAVFAAEETVECGILTGSFLKCIEDGFSFITETIGYLLAAITAKLISFAAYFIQVMIKLSPGIIRSPVVQEGFKITLSFANLGFVLAVIFIAFITIFRLQGYETKKLIRNLIVAAVLVNFSFTFAGLIMDASNIFGNFFIDAIIGDSGAENITNSIASALNVHKLNTATPTAGAMGDALALGAIYYKTIFSLAFMILFNSVMVVTFFVIAGLMVVRYVTISILLIVMPFAWLCWIFPSLQRHWSAWWGAFLKWNIFLPVLMFFIYIAAFTAAKVGEAVKDGGAGLQSQAAAGDLTTFAAIGISDIAQGLVMVGLLFGGMIIAQKLGVAGSGAIMTGSGRVKGWVTGAAISATGAPLAGRMAKQTGMAAVGVAASAREKTMAKVYGGAAALAGRVGLRGAQSNLLARAEAPKEALKQAIKDRVKEIEKLPDSAFTALLQSNALTQQEKAARAVAVAQKGNIKEIEEQIGANGKEKIDSYLKAAGATGVGKSISESRVDLARRMEEGYDVSKKTADWGAEEWKKQKPEVFADKDVLANIDPEILSAALKGKGGASPKKMDAILKGAAELAKAQPKHEMVEFVKANTLLLGALQRKTDKIERVKEKGGKITAEQEEILAFYSKLNIQPEEKTQKPRGKGADEKAKDDFLNLPT